MRSFNEALDLVARAVFKGLNEDVTFPCSPARPVTQLGGMATE